MFIFLCPKAFSSNSSSLERDFLKFYITKKGSKAVISNGLWEAFRFRILNNSTNKDNAQKFIAEQSGFFKPETRRFVVGSDEELPPEKDWTSEELLENTKDFIKRNWVDIDLFITLEPEKYEDLEEIKNVSCMTLEEFYLDCINDIRYRELLEEFWIETERCKW